jgi:hypothetical protein
MTPVPTPRPGNMTVPPTFGWEDIATALLVVSVVAVAFLLIGAAAASLGGRSEWHAYLGARSGRGEAGAGVREDDAPVHG